MHLTLPPLARPQEANMGKRQKHIQLLTWNCHVSSHLANFMSKPAMSATGLSARHPHPDVCPAFVLRVAVALV